MDSIQQPTPASAGAVSKPAHNSARSCITCAKAKAKCVRQPGQRICERCTRLNKDCQLKEPVQRKRKPTKLTRTAQLENLENKLSNLVHALSAQQSQQLHRQSSEPKDHGHPSPSASSGASEEEQPVAGQILNSSCHQTVPDSALSSCGQSNPTALTPGSSLQTSQSSTQDTTISMTEASALLNRYKRLMAPSLPFVVIPEDTDAWALTHQKPFLMQVIATVAFFHDLPRQQFMVKDLMRQISERLLMRNEKSLEVLQGMLILIAWYHPHIMWAQQSVLLLHLAMSLTADLNIDRAPDSCEKFRLANGVNAAVPPFSNDERRAFLGTYYLTAMMSTSFKKLSALKWTSWMTDCARMLEKGVEYESDKFLVALVRTQHLMEDVMAVETFDAPVRFFAKSYEADLDRIPTPALTGHPKMLLEQQQASARVAIWTHSINGLTEMKSKHAGELRQRLDGMWRLVQAIRAYFELYFTISAQDFLTLPFPVFGQSVHASVTLLRLSTLEVDGWDLAALQEELSYSTIIGEITRIFELVEKVQTDGMSVNNDAFTKWAAKTRWMKSLYDARYPPVNGASSSDRAISINVAEGGRRWPAGEISQQQTQTQTQSGAGNTANANANFATQPQQQPTPSDDWMTNPQTVFTYFDDAFWNSFSFENFDYGAAAAGMPDVQMGV